MLRVSIHKYVYVGIPAPSSSVIPLWVPLMFYLGAGLGTAIRSNHTANNYPLQKIAAQMALIAIVIYTNQPAGHKLRRNVKKKNRNMQSSSSAGWLNEFSIQAGPLYEPWVRRRIYHHSNYNAHKPISECTIQSFDGNILIKWGEKQCVQ